MSLLQSLEAIAHRRAGLLAKLLHQLGINLFAHCRHLSSLWFQWFLVSLRTSAPIPALNVFLKPPQDQLPRFLQKKSVALNPGGHASLIMHSGVRQKD
jgi:hypothetical protein